MLQTAMLPFSLGLIALFANPANAQNSSCSNKSAYSIDLREHISSYASLQTSTSTIRLQSAEQIITGCAIEEASLSVSGFTTQAGVRYEKNGATYVPVSADYVRIKTRCSAFSLATARPYDALCEPISVPYARNSFAAVTYEGNEYKLSLFHKSGLIVMLRTKLKPLDMMYLPSPHGLGGNIFILLQSSHSSVVQVVFLV
ncbi:hypothetical protein KZ813_10250 [Sphingomonas sp. RHCKR7]|uniref:hypothetical protein n=1 Tax=Sphingomonas folli TaxID=2862497 RepID=UPI001CA5B02A|nr:hypothetical protein [Sphingomonas folli]MBW6527220.1 hypothetical protein [Sphingomonas folli]